jgi:hypothetical protein
MITGFPASRPFLIIPYKHRNRASSDGLWAGQLGFDSQEVQDFALLYSIPAGSWVHPASYPMGTGGYLQGVQVPGREADHTPVCLHGVMLK